MRAVSCIVTAEDHAFSEDSIGNFVAIEKRKAVAS